MKKNIKSVIIWIFVLFFTIVAFVDIRGSFLEYKELGEQYISIFKIKYIYKYSIEIINFIIIYFIMYFCGRGIKKGLKAFFDEEKKELPKLANKSIAFIISSIISIIVEIRFMPRILLMINQAAFIETDGVFNLDISTYVFTLPVIKMILIYAILICIGLIVYSAIYYILVFNKYFDGIDKDTLKNSKLVKNIIKYVRCIAIIFGILTIVRITDIVFDNFIITGSGQEIIGAGVVNITIKIVGDIILAIMLVISIFYATANLEKGNNSKALKNVLIVPTYLVIMFCTMVGFDLIFVNSNEYDKEKSHIERNILYTQNAYGINCENDIVEYSGTITEEEIEKNSNIINNSVIVSQKQALQSLNDNQTEKGYYTYRTAGIAKYEDKLIYIAPKEISNARRTFNSKTFEYTHGYGTIMVLATSVTEDGEVEYMQESNNTQQIYYGLETNNSAVINIDSNDEYDYTDNKGIEYTTSFKGNSGLNLNFIDRLILGMKKGDLSLAFSGKINNESKILINRNIINRAKLALSGADIVYDENPYMILDKDGNLYWVLDGYTISDSYPYSAYSNITINGERKRINYIRNSLKVIINSYDGSMKFYVTDTTDPIIMTYRNIYPKLFEDINEQIPEEIRKNLVYPEFLYNIQTSILKEYHNVKSEVLYRGDDSWDKINYNGTLNSYYTAVNKENEQKIGLIQIYSQKGKQSLTSYLVGTVKDGVNKLHIYVLSSDESILGLNQLDNKIMQDERISEEIEKLNVTGAKVTKNMMIVPVDNTLLYIQEIYQTKMNESNIPKLKKIIVASGNKVAIGDNLNQALENLASSYATSIDTYTTENIDDLIKSIIKANHNLDQSMNSKDLELIGSDVKKIQELISLLEKEEKKQEDNKNEIVDEENEIIE